jgi:hypothetical protein
MLGITTTNARVGGFRGGILADSKTIYNRIIADGGVSNLSRLNFFVKGLKAIYGDLANVPVCYDAHWIGYKLGSGTGATAGQAAAKLYSLTVAGDAVQATAASQPLLLSHNGSDNYWWGSGVTGNFMSTPNATANQITGDIEIVANIRLDLLTGIDFYCILDKSLSANYQYILEYNKADGKLYYSYNVGGSNLTKKSTVTLASAGITVSTNFWVKLTRTSSDGNVKYYTSLQSEVTTLSSLIFTQLGATIAGTSGASTAYNAKVNIGEYNANGSTVGIENFLGRIYRLTLSNSIGGTPVVDFNPATYNASTSQTNWTSATGEVWTINTGTATTGYKGVLVDRTIVQGDGVDDTMQSGTITTRTNFTRYFAFNTIIAGNTQYFIDGDISNRHIIYKGSSQLRLYNDGTGAGEILNANTVGLKLITGDYNTSSSKLRTNAGADTTGTVGNATSTKVTLFSAGSGGTNANITFTTLIDAIAVDNNTIKTAVYSFLKTLNNNAF